MKKFRLLRLVYTLSLALAVQLFSIQLNNELHAGCGSPPPPPPPPPGGADSNVVSLLNPTYWWSANRSEILFKDLSLELTKEKEHKLYSGELSQISKERSDELLKQFKDLFKLITYRGDFDSLIRQMALKKIGKFTPSEMNVVVERYAEIKNPAQRLGAIIALGEAHFDEARDLLNDIFKNSRWSDEQAFSALSLAKISETTHLNLMIERLKDRSVSQETRCFMTLALAKFLNDEHADTLHSIALDRSELTIVRRACILSLSLNQNKKALPLLEKISMDFNNPFLMSTAIQGLSFLKNSSDEALQILIKLLNSKDAQTRGLAAMSINQLGASADVKDMLFKKLKSEKDIRALEGLAITCGSLVDNEHDLLVAKSFLKKSAHKRVVYFMALGLGISGYPDALTCLQKALHSRHPPLAERGIVLGLSFLGGEQAAQIVTNVLKDIRKADLRELAAFSLGYMKDTNSLTALTQAMFDRDWLVRHSAVVSQGVFGESAKKNVPQIKLILEKDKIPIVRLAAAFSLDVFSENFKKLHTLEVISQLNDSMVPSIKADRIALLQEVNKHFPRFQKSSIGW